MSIRSAYIAYVPFRDKPFGHVLIIFVSVGGERIAISPEADVSMESFSLLRGLTRSYRLRYIIEPWDSHMQRYQKAGRVAEEYALSLSRTQLEALYTAILSRAEMLEKQTEWYHTLFNSCVTNIMDHLDQARSFKRSNLSKVFIAAAPSRLGIN